MRKVVLVNVVLSVLLLVFGILMNLTGSSLSCPDWPLCYGKVLPSFNEYTFLSLGHRFLSAVVGLLTFFVFKKTKNGETKPFAWWAIVLLIIQAVLGGIAVKYELPPVTSIIHLILALVFICILINIYQLLNPKEYQVSQIENVEKLRDLSFFIYAMIFYQVTFGAVLRFAGKDLYYLELTKMHFYSGITIGLFSLVSLLLIKAKFKELKVLNIDLLAMSALIAGQFFLGIYSSSYGLSLLPRLLHILLAFSSFVSAYSLLKKAKRFDLATNDQITPSFISDVIDLTKPRLTALVVMTALIGLLMVPVKLDVVNSFFALFFIYLLVAGACALNCYVERDLDKKMDRTKDRALPSGRMNPIFALMFASSLIVFSTALIYMYVNPLTAALGLLSAVLYIYAYTPLKRKSVIALFVGAIPGALPPVLGWTAITGTLDTMAIILFSIIFVWQVPHFMAISIFRKQDYEAADIKTYPSRDGITRTKKNIVLYTVCLIIVSLIPYFLDMTSMTYLLLSVVLGLGMLFIAFKGFKSSEVDTDRTWARTYFFATLGYLPGVFILLAFF